jgi:hypothetical protein
MTVVGGAGDGLRIQNIYKLESFGIYFHVIRKGSLASEICRVRFTPIVKRTVAFALIAGERFIDLIEPKSRELSSFNHNSWTPLSIFDDHSLADLGAEGPMNGSPGCGGLSTFKNKAEQFVRHC